MPRITAHLSMSLDGFVAGPDQSLENPLGIGGPGLHGWHMGSTDPVDLAMAEILMAPRGAYVMGRNMFGPVRGEWSEVNGEQWRGWWGEEPPYHAPVFVLTHYPQDPIELEGTTFHFVGDFDEAIRLAGEAAASSDVSDLVTIAGGASAVRQGLERGIVDELMINHAPVSLGSGESIFTGLQVSATPAEVHASPNATHVIYRF
jgi:dihydrofolate reductase